MPNTTIQDHIAAASSDEDFDVRPSPSDGPAEAAAKVAKIIIGDGPESRPGDLDVDEEELERRIASKGKQRCRVFLLNDQEQADAFADLLQRSEVDRTVRIVGKAKDMVDGIQHAVSVRWVEFKEPYGKIADAERKAMQPANRDRTRALLDKIGGGDGSGATSLHDDGVRCLGLTASGKQCSRRRFEDTQHCRQHQPKPIEAVDMDEPPLSHAGMP